MKLQGTYRTFTKLERFDQEVIKALQLGIHAVGGKRLGHNAILQFIIRHYWDLLLEHGNPELVKAVREKVTNSPGKFSISAILERTPVSSKSSTESDT
jgi:hypothetical protein